MVVVPKTLSLSLTTVIDSSADTLIHAPPPSLSTRDVGPNISPLLYLRLPVIRYRPHPFTVAPSVMELWNMPLYVLGRRVRPQFLHQLDSLAR